MQYMFQNASAFNQSIDSWNVSSVVDMSAMFVYATAFNQPIGTWTVSKVVNMNDMFAYAASFNQPIGSWDVSSVFSLTQMFAFAASFNQPIGSWDVRNVMMLMDMNEMFLNASAFNQSLVSWCVTNIIDRPGMFADNSKLSMEHEPRWGTCPLSAPAAPPETAITQPTQVACVGPSPQQGNVSCIDGRWIIFTYVASVLSNPAQQQQSTTVTFAANTTLVVSDPLVAQNLTIVVPISGSDTSTAGRLQVRNCVSLIGGRVRIQALNSVSFQNGEKILIVFSDHPECFNITMMTSTVVEETSCAQTTIASPRVELQQNLASLFAVVDFVAGPGCQPEQPLASSGAVSAGLVDGVVAGVIAFAALAAVAIWIFKRRHECMKEKQVQQQAMHSKLEHAEAHINRL